MYPDKKQDVIAEKCQIQLSRLSVGFEFAVGEGKVDVLSRALRYNPSAGYYSEAMYELGRAYVASGNNDAAVKAFDKLRVNTDDKTIAGSLYVVYGPLPRKSSLKVVRSISRSNLPETLSSYSAQLDNVDWSKLEEVLGDRGALIQRMMPGGTLNVDSLSGSLSGQSGMPFLYFFRKLSLGYQKALKQGKESTYYLTSLLDLCKKQHSAVSDDERQLCTDELQRLLEMTKAEFDRAVLQECMKLVGR